MNYYEVTITKTTKPMGRTEDGYRVFDQQKECFSTIHDVKQFLKEEYGNSKRVKSYIDTKKGTKQAGYIYCFKNADYSHYPLERWYQQDWVDIAQLKSKRVYLV